MKLSRKELESKASVVLAKQIKRALTRKDLSQSERIGERLGRLVFRLFKQRRKRTLDNLALAFPEKSSQERYLIARGVFEHFGRIMSDFARTDVRSKQETLSSVELDGFADVHEMFPDREGMIMLTGHFGNWERCAHYMSLSGYPMSVVVRDANDDELNGMVLDTRRAAGLEIISRGNAARQVLGALKKHRAIAMLPDQNSDEAFLPFFGRPCGTVLGPGVLAKRAKVSVYAAFCYRTGPGQYRLRRVDYIQGEEIAELTPEEVMTRFNAALESIVREFPDQYLWMHDRWKNARRRGMLS
jgi:KDO2-lipid IV(A) lauroyltransferase